MTNYANPGALPGGLIGPETPGPINANRWVRPGTEKYCRDTSLEHTSVRWADGHWYVVTTGALPHTGPQGGPIQDAVRRSGPYDSIDQVEDRLTTETGADSGNGEEPDPTNEQIETIDATIREGMVKRLYDAANRWVTASATDLQSEAPNRRPQAGDWERHSTFEFNQDDENAQELGEMYEYVVKAADAYRQWLTQ